jgi:hypothetical protein
VGKTQANGAALVLLVSAVLGSPRKMLDAVRHRESHLLAPKFRPFSLLIFLKKKLVRRSL